MPAFGSMSKHTQGLTHLPMPVCGNCLVTMQPPAVAATFPAHPALIYQATAVFTRFRADLIRRTR
jgi:hypothetical protein